MFKKTRILAAVGAAVGAVALAAPMAIAGPTATWTITPTGNFTGTAGVTTLTDNVGNVIQCATASANGNAPASPVSGPGLATINSASFNAPCSGPFGSTWAVSAVTPWSINGTSYTAGAGSNSTGRTTGWVGGIKATVTGSSILGPCTFDAIGTVDATYNNPSTGGANGTLVVAPAASGPRLLTISNKVGGGCGIVGATATFKGNYKVVSTSGVSPVISYTP